VSRSRGATAWPFIVDSLDRARWKQVAPNEAGYWLRLNAGGRVQMHYVMPKYDGSGVLIINWGHSGRADYVEVTDSRISGWWWYGPIPRPPERAV